MSVERGAINVRSIRFVLCVLGIVSATWAQAASTSQISGIVHDLTGASIPAATVKVIQTDTGFMRSAVTSSDGAYLLELSTSPDEEVRLRDVVRFFLAPARCGIFLSRGQLGRMAMGLGMRLPFGSRFEVAETLFQVAGEAGQIEPLIAALEAEFSLWRDEYTRWAENYPNWQAPAEMWLARSSKATGQLSEMRQAVATERS